MENLNAVKIKIGQIFEVDEKLYVIFNPTTAIQETNEHGQMVFLLQELHT